MTCGWVGRILFVDLSKGELKDEVPEEELLYRLEGEEIGQQSGFHVAVRATVRW